MTQARSTQVDLSATPYYHCIARCVRRAFLCGQDDFSGRNYEHRREWVVERLKALSETFAIQILSFAVLSNHYHVVVHIDETQAKAWRDREVIERWAKLFPGNLAADYTADIPMKMHEKHWVMEQVPTWRQRLHDLSWYMRSLNEWLARRANEEDKCSGRLSSRPREFHPQPLPKPYVTLSCHTAPTISLSVNQTIAN